MSKGKGHKGGSRGDAAGDRPARERRRALVAKIRERADRMRKKLVGRTHSDSGVLQAEDRRR